MVENMDYNENGYQNNIPITFDIDTFTFVNLLKLMELFSKFRTNMNNSSLKEFKNLMNELYSLQSLFVTFVNLSNYLVYEDLNEFLAMFIGMNANDNKHTTMKLLAQIDDIKDIEVLCSDSKTLSLLRKSNNSLSEKCHRVLCLRCSTGDKFGDLFVTTFVEHCESVKFNDPETLKRKLSSQTFEHNGIHINAWDVSKVTDMSGMFANLSDFNEPLDNWDVSQVTDMSEMFAGCHNFDQPLHSWDVSQVTNMSEMFGYSKLFNQNINTISYIFFT